MASVPIDDDFRVVRRARRHHRVAGVVIGTGVCAVVGGVVWSVVTASGWPLIMSGIGALYVADGRGAERNTRETRRLSTTEPPEIEWDEHGLTVRHPTLPEPLRQSWSSLRACSVEPMPEKLRWRPLQYDLFAIHRSPGSLHPLDEPRWFLSTHDHELDKRPVLLTSVDLSGQIPNVALLFRDRLSVSIAAPLMPNGTGWIPGAVGLSGGRSFYALTLPLARKVRTLSAPGLCLRVDDHARLASALGAGGVRHGFTCDDWSFATGQRHELTTPRPS